VFWDNWKWVQDIRATTKKKADEYRAYQERLEREYIQVRIKRTEEDEQAWDKYQEDIKHWKDSTCCPLNGGNGCSLFTCEYRLRYLDKSDFMMIMEHLHRFSIFGDHGLHLWAIAMHTDFINKIDLCNQDGKHPKFYRP
jgi:hypothetical protein